MKKRSELNEDQPPKGFRWVRVPLPVFPDGSVAFVAFVAFVASASFHGHRWKQCHAIARTMRR